ncbi:MAG: hypothetical protein KR126chlam3_01178 [Chlamydiae bacterium]|nr:hypothetical protein [Chlamydiota bacterium]
MAEADLASVIDVEDFDLKLLSFFKLFLANIINPLM